MTTEVAALLITLALFVLGLAYHAGRVSMRVDKLEEWRGEMRTEVHEVFQALRRVERLIKGEEG